jgi:hypothetical protein
MKTSILHRAICIFTVVLGISVTTQASARHFYHSDASQYRLVKVHYIPISDFSILGLSNSSNSAFMGILRIPLTPIPQITLFDGGHDGDHGKGHKDSSGGHHGKDSTGDGHGKDTTGHHHDGGNDTTSNHHDGGKDTTNNHHDGDNDTTGNHHDGGKDTTSDHHDGGKDTTNNHHDGDNDTTGNHHDGGKDTTNNHHDGDNDTTGHHHGGDNDSTGDNHGHHDGDSTDIGGADTVESHGPGDNDSTDVDDSTDHALFGGGIQSILVKSQGEQAAISFRFTNNLTVPVTITNITLASGKNFTIISGAPAPMNPITLASGAGITMKIAFKTTDHQMHNDQLMILSSGKQTPSTITLQGIELAAASVSGSLPSGVTIIAMPNPMTSSLKVGLSGVNSASITIFDVMGKQVLSSPVHSTEWIWNGTASDGTTLLSGSYFIRVSGMSSEGAPFVSTQKIILQH